MQICRKALKTRSPLSEGEEKARAHLPRQRAAGTPERDVTGMGQQELLPRAHPVDPSGEEAASSPASVHPQLLSFQTSVEKKVRGCGVIEMSPGFIINKCHLFKNRNTLPPSSSKNEASY